MTPGTYIHADGTECRDGIDPATVAIWAAAQDDDDGELTPPPRIRCHAGRLVAGYRLDPDQPAP
jgi:hypothetical protein